MQKENKMHESGRTQGDNKFGKSGEAGVTEKIPAWFTFIYYMAIMAVFAVIATAVKLLGLI